MIFLTSAEFTTDFFFDNASIWVFFIAAFIILILDKLISEPSDKSLPMFFTCLGSIVLSILLSVVVLNTSELKVVEARELIINFSKIGVIIVNIALFFLAFISYSSGNRENDNNLASNYFFLLIAGIGGIIAVKSVDILLIFAGLALMSVGFIASIIADNKSNQLSEVPTKPVTCAIIRIFTAMAIFVVAIVFLALNTAETSLIQTSNVESTSKSANVLCFAGFWVSLLILFSIDPFFSWFSKLSRNISSFHESLFYILYKFVIFMLMVKVYAGFSDTSEVILLIVNISAIALLIYTSITLLSASDVDEIKHRLVDNQFAFGLLTLNLIGQTSTSALQIIVMFTVSALVCTSCLFMILSVGRKNHESADNSTLLYIRSTKFSVVLSFIVLSIAAFPLTIGFFARFSTIAGFFYNFTSNAHFIGIIAILCNVLVLYFIIRFVARLFSKSTIHDESELVEKATDDWILGFVSFFLILSQCASCFVFFSNSIF